MNTWMFYSDLLDALSTKNIEVADRFILCSLVLINILSIAMCLILSYRALAFGYTGVVGPILGRPPNDCAKVKRNIRTLDRERRVVHIKPILYLVYALIGGTFITLNYSVLAPLFLGHIFHYQANAARNSENLINIYKIKSQMIYVFQNIPGIDGYNILSHDIKSHPDIWLQKAYATLCWLPLVALTIGAGLLALIRSRISFPDDQYADLKWREQCCELEPTRNSRRRTAMNPDTCTVPKSPVSIS